MASFARLMTLSLAVLLAAAVLPAADTTEDAATAGASTATMEKTESAQTATGAADETADDKGQFVGLLEYTAVQNALGLDQKQKQQITDVNSSLDKSVPDPDALRDLPVKQREMLLQTWEAKAQQLKDKLGQVLNPEQAKRLKEIALQLRLKMRASSLLAEKNLAEKLSITESQKQELESLRQRVREQISKARETLVQSGQESQQITAEKTEQFRKQFRELRDKAHQQALDILTPEQKEKLSELTGKAADINIDELLTEQSARVEKWASRWKQQREANGKAAAGDETQAEHQVGTITDDDDKDDDSDSTSDSDTGEKDY